MIEAHATAKYIRSSAQKAGLVMDMIRGRSVDEAFATLQFARKSVARDIEKVLRSAVANAQHKEGFGGDVDRLMVSACYANQGPSLKRVRPAPMGRAFRILKRTTHLTVEVVEVPKRKTAAKRKTASTRKTAAKGKAVPKAGATRAAETEKSSTQKPPATKKS